MFGAPLRDFCLRDVETPSVVENPPVVEGFVNEVEPSKSEKALDTACREMGYVKSEEPEMPMPEEPVEEPVEEPEMPMPEGPVEEPEMPEEPVEEPEMPEEPVEEFSNCNSHKKEGFSNRVLFGQRFLSLDLALRAVLYALLFYIVSHNDTQGLLKGVVKRLPKVVKPFAPMLLFGVLYYVLNLFI